MPTFRNNRTNETITTDLDRTALAARFAEGSSDDNWIWYWIAKEVERMGVRASRPEQTIQQKASIDFLADSFVLAIGMGLKKPMIRCWMRTADGTTRRYKVYLSQRGTLCIKGGDCVRGTSDPYGDEEYVGCIYQGRFLPNRDRTPCLMDLDLVENLTNDAAGFLATNGKDMDRCCYCDDALTDPRSKERGYGPVCAGRWGLPWGDKKGTQEIPSFAHLWLHSDSSTKRNVRGLCQGIRENPTHEDLWAILGDVLEEAGWKKRPVAPASRVTLPAR